MAQLPCEHRIVVLVAFSMTGQSAPPTHLQLSWLGYAIKKCWLGIDDTSGQLKVEGWLYIVFIFLYHIIERHHCIENLGDQPHR